jgi:DNA-binding transcriptional LysR family regulator
MDLNRLRYFCVIAETGSLRRAADLLRVSAPALSKAVKLLEAETGKKLIAPSGRGIVITDPGRALAERARGILRGVDELRGGLAARADAGRPVRIGSFEVFTTYFLGPLLRAHLPDVPAMIHDLTPGILEKALVDRQVDLGVTYVPVPSAELEHVAVAPIEMGIYARRGAFDHEPFPRIPFAVPITPLAGSPDRIRGLDGWPDDAVPRNVKFQVTLMESALELCRQGLAAAYLPRFVVRLHNLRVRDAFKLHPLRAPPGARASRQHVYLVRRRTELEGAVFRKVAKALRVECRSGE